MTRRGSYLNRAAPGLSAPAPPARKVAMPSRTPPPDPAGRIDAMFGSIARAFFGSANDRSLKTYQRRVPQINALEPAMTGAFGRGAARQDRRVQGPDRRGRHARRTAARSLRGGARGRAPHARPAPFRRPAGRRHGAARRQDRRDEDRRGQDPGRHPACLPQRAHRQGRARRHRQRLPGPARRRMDGRRSTASSA